MVGNWGKGEEAGGRRKSAGTKTGRGIPTDSTPRRKHLTIKLGMRRGDGWTGNSGRALPAGDSGRRLSEGSPDRDQEGLFPTGAISAGNVHRAPAPRHQRSLPYLETGGYHPQVSDRNINPLGEAPGHHLGSNHEFYVKVPSQDFPTFYMSFCVPTIGDFTSTVVTSSVFCDGVRCVRDISTVHLLRYTEDARYNIGGQRNLASKVTTWRVLRSQILSTDTRL